MSSNEQIETHPSGALIQISRCSGQTRLFGSEFDHQHYVSLKITPAKEKRSLGRTWYTGKLNPYVEVNLSASQFAEAITTMNVGCGVPCTMRYLEGHAPFTPVKPVSQRSAFEAEGSKAMADSVAAIDEALAALATVNLTKTARAQLTSNLQTARRKISDRLPFLVEAYAEHLNEVEQKAKTEIAAYVDHVQQTTGVNGREFLQIEGAVE